MNQNPTKYMSYTYNHEHTDTLSMEGTFGIKIFVQCCWALNPAMP